MVKAAAVVGGVVSPVCGMKFAFVCECVLLMTAMSTQDRCG